MLAEHSAHGSDASGSVVCRYPDFSCLAGGGGATSVAREGGKTSVACTFHTDGGGTRGGGTRPRCIVIVVVNTVEYVSIHQCDQPAEKY